MLGILNFAHGAIYMVAGYVGFVLTVELGVSPWTALVMTTLALAVFGIFLEKFCFRPFVGNFNRIVMVCVAVTIILQTTVNIIAGTKVLAIPAFAKGVLTAGPISVSYERIVTFAVGAILLVIIVWIVNRTKWGQQMQAIAQNMDAARLQGINVRHISALACALGCGLAAIAGCMMAAYLGLAPFVGDFMLIKALMLIILAGVGSVGGIFIAGLVLGSLNSILPVLTGGAASEAIAVAIVVILLLIRPKGFFGHEIEMASDSQLSESASNTISTGIGKWAKPASYLGLVIIVALLPLFVRSPYTLHILILSFIYVIAAVSLRTITISGQFPMAHGAFMGIGAYVAGMASRWLGWPPWITIPVAALVSMGLGILTGYPFARLRALYYAMGSLFFGIGIVLIIVAGGVWTGSYSGLTGIHPIFGGSKELYYYLFLGLALVSTLALYRFEFSRIGINLKSIAQSHMVASSVGINEGFHRILAVAVGCFFAGLAGAGYAHYNLVLSPGSFNFLATLWLVMYVLVGGIGSFAGPIIGTFVLFLTPEIFRDLKIYSPFISAAILIVVVYFMPQGLVGLPQLVRSGISREEKEKLRTLLELRATITKLFGGLAAVSQFDTAANKEEIVGLTGPSGTRIPRSLIEPFAERVERL